MQQSRLVIAGLALLVLVLASRWRERAVALFALAILVPGCFGAHWLGEVQIDGPHGNRTYCVGGGPIDTGDACGAAYVGRYVSLMLPLTLLLTLLVYVVVVQVRTKIDRRHTSLGEPYPPS